MTERRDVTVSVSTDINSNLLLTIWTDIVEGEAVRITLSPGRAATLLRDLTMQTTYALTAAAMGAARGDCATCVNVRMVKTVGAAGRESNDHCPDCRVDAAAGFPRVPQVGGGLA